MLTDALARITDKKVWRSAPTATDWGRCIEVSAEIIPLPTECLEFLRTNQIPEDVIADLQACSYAGFIRLGPLSLPAVADLSAANSGANEPCLQHGYLVLASGANGDPVCVHRETRKMVFVSHDLLWEHEYEDFQECVQESPYLYEEFWERAALEKDFPWDYYEAQRRWSGTIPLGPEEQATISTTDASSSTPLIREMALDRLSNLKSRVFHCDFGGRPNLTALLLEFSGKFGRDALGQNDAAYMEAVKCAWTSIMVFQGLIFDFRELEFESSDSIWRVFEFGHELGIFDEENAKPLGSPVALVVSPKCRAGFESSGQQAPPLFDDPDKALQFVEEGARRFRDGLFGGRPWP